MNFTQIETDRLLLRRFTESDIRPFVAYRADPEISRYQLWEEFSLDEGRKLLSEMINHDIDIPGTWFQIALEQRDSGELIGDLAVHTMEADPRQIEIGFTLAQEHQGKGYASEALSALINSLFRELGKHRVTAICDAKNASAVRLLERLGFRREGHFIQNIWFKGAWGDEYLYAILNSEWLVTPTDIQN